MNFLAHIYLSGSDHEILMGNFIADSVKGKKALLQFPENDSDGVYDTGLSYRHCLFHLMCFWCADKAAAHRIRHIKTETRLACLRLPMNTAADSTLVNLMNDYWCDQHQHCTHLRV